MKIWFFQMVFLGCSIGNKGPRIDYGLPLSLRESFGRKLHQFTGNCSKGSDQILTEYPSLVSLRDPMIIEEPNVNVLCGGVLLSTNTILTSTGCIWYKFDYVDSFNLVDENPVNRTFERDFKVAISPYCTHGDGAEVLQILGYHFMEEDYTGYPKDGNSVTLLELRENVTSLTNSDLPALRTDPLPVGSIIVMIGHGATTNDEANSKNSRPFKKINYQTISDEECDRLLEQQQSNKDLDGVTETCAVVQEIGGENVCQGDDGNPLYDQDGKIAGIITWWPINKCEKIGDQSLPIIFADVSKQKIQEFVEKTGTESLYILPNITQGCGDGQTLQAAPWSISIQFPRQYGPLSYHHICGGALIDNGQKILTVAQCIWHENTTLAIGYRERDDRQPWDLRESGNPYVGKFSFPIFASLSPRCRHLNGVYERIQLSDYYIHPEYDGNPGRGNNIAIFGLAEQFPPDQSFPNFEEYLKSIDGMGPQEYAFSDVRFYGWGADYIEEAIIDKNIYFNNYFPAKQISMELIHDEQCQETGYADQSEVLHFSFALSIYSFNLASELCTDQFSIENYINICSYDKGGPLVGRLNDTNELVLLGLKSYLHDGFCFAGRKPDKESYEVFTDVIKMKNFILNSLNPPPPPIAEPQDPPPFPTPQSPFKNGSSVVVITITVVGGSLLFIIVISVIAWRRISYNKKVLHSETQLLLKGGSSNFSSEALVLNEDVQNIYLMLGNVACKYKNPQTGKFRRHSDIAVTLDFILSQEKLQVQILGYTQCSFDDSFLGATRGALPSSPFLLAEMQNQQQQLDMENTIQPIQQTIRKRIQNRIQMSIDVNFANELKGLQNSNRGLVFPDTPPRPDLNMTIDFDKELLIADRLGTGAFGSVYKAVWLTRNMEVAVKIILAERLSDDQKQREKLFSSIHDELSLLGRIDSPHVVKCYGGSLKPPNIICLVLEYVSRGSLDSFIHNYHGQMPTGLIMRVAQGIAEGLDALHPAIVHRDLKPQNVLLDDTYRVKLADFGLSKMKEDTYLSDTVVRGTPAYIAPEALKEESVDEKCDIYALGLIIWEMVSKERPWRGFNFPVIMNLVANKEERPPIPHTCPPDLKRLIQRCWAQNPRERPTAREIVQRLTILRRGSAKASNSDINAFSNYFNNLKKNITVQQPQYEEPSFNFSQISIKTS